MRIKHHISIIALLLATTFATAQEQQGNAIIQIFSNFHTGMYNYNNERGFELERSYLGYQYKINNSLSVKAVMDIGSPNATSNDYDRLAYIKYAQVTWKTSNFVFQGGLIPNLLFNLQEKFWGYRYVMQSFQGEYKFGSSADLGISASYKITNWLSADAIIANGEGYKKLQRQDGLLYGMGITINPIKSLTFRVYTSLNEGVGNEANTQNLALFAGYKCKWFSIGAESNYVKGLKHIPGHNMVGTSVYSTVRTCDINEIFIRYDNLGPMHTHTYSDEDEKSITIGTQFKIGNHILIAPNFRIIDFQDGNEPNKYMAYINCSFNL